MGGKGKVTMIGLMGAEVIRPVTGVAQARWDAKP